MRLYNKETTIEFLCHWAKPLDWQCIIILFFFTLIVNQINCDCLYPEWKQTCQKYCMSNQLYEIQLNQCYSMNPDQLTCKCSGKNLTEKNQKYHSK